MIKISKTVDREIIGIGIIFNSCSECLIARRLNDGFMGGMWEFPGGKKESQETVETTILRECKEEVDLKVKVGACLVDFDYSYSKKNFHFFVHLCQLLSGEAKPLASQEIKWVKPQKLVEYSFPEANQQIINTLFKYLEKEKIHTNNQ